MLREDKNWIHVQGFVFEQNYSENCTNNYVIVYRSQINKFNSDKGLMLERFTTIASSILTRASMKFQFQQNYRVKNSSPSVLYI